jgi:hypothetical protein
VLALFGMLLAFTVSGAGARFDIEFPRLGLIRVDAFDQALVELQETMK